LPGICPLAMMHEAGRQGALAANDIRARHLTAGQKNSIAISRDFSGAAEFRLPARKKRIERRQSENKNIDALWGAASSRRVFALAMQPRKNLFRPRF
jgi:hypothetical protein